MSFQVICWKVVFLRVSVCLVISWSASALKVLSECASAKWRAGEKQMVQTNQKLCSNVDLVRFSSVAQSCLTLCDPMNLSTPGLPVHHQLPESTQTHVHWVGDAIQPSHPLSSPPPPALNLSQHQGLFESVSSSHEVNLDTPQIFHSELHLFLGGSGGVLGLALLARTADCQILGVWAGCQTWPLLKI